MTDELMLKKCVCVYESLRSLTTLMELQNQIVLKPWIPPCVVLKSIANITLHISLNRIVRCSFNKSSIIFNIFSRRRVIIPNLNHLFLLVKSILKRRDENSLRNQFWMSHYKRYIVALSLFWWIFAFLLHYTKHDSLSSLAENRENSFHKLE